MAAAPFLYIYTYTAVLYNFSSYMIKLNYNVDDNNVRGCVVGKTRAHIPHLYAYIHAPLREFASFGMG